MLFVLESERSSISLCTNVQPSQITVAACCRWPKRDSNFLLSANFLPNPPPDQTECASQLLLCAADSPIKTNVEAIADAIEKVASECKVWVVSKLSAPFTQYEWGSHSLQPLRHHHAISSHLEF